MDPPAAEPGLGSTYAGAMRSLIATRYFRPERTPGHPVGILHPGYGRRLVDVPSNWNGEIAAALRLVPLPVLERVLEESIGIGP